MSILFNQICINQKWGSNTDTDRHTHTQCIYIYIYIWIEVSATVEWMYVNNINFDS